MLKLFCWKYLTVSAILTVSDWKSKWLFVICWKHLIESIWMQVLHWKDFIVSFWLLLLCLTYLMESIWVAVPDWKFLKVFLMSKGYDWRYLNICTKLKISNGLARYCQYNKSSHNHSVWYCITCFFISMQLWNAIKYLNMSLNSNQWPLQMPSWLKLLNTTGKYHNHNLRSEKSSINHWL